MKYKLGFLKNKKIRNVLIVAIACLAISSGIYYRYTQAMPQATVHFMNDVKLPSAGQKVLVFSPHPDDETIAAGGYIAESENNKADVKIILVTDGNIIHQKAKRYKEFRSATKLLGVPSQNLVFLNYPDNHLSKQNLTEVYNKFKHEVDIYQPDIIIYPHPKDQHKDHSTTGKIVSKIIKSENNNNYISYEYLVHHPRFPQPKKMRPEMYLTPPISMVSFDKEWQRLMLPESIEDQKNEAVLVYKTQLNIPFLRSILLGMIRKNELFATH